MKRILNLLLIQRLLPLHLALLAVVLVLPAAWTGFQQDDLVHRYMLLGNADIDGKPRPVTELFSFLDGNTEYTHALMDRGLIPWWSLESVRLTFYRPLSALSHGLDYLLWPNSAPMMHIQSFLWFGALIAAVTILYKQLLGEAPVAGLAALFYAIDDAHGLPAGWLAGRNALISALFGVLVLLFHDRWRRRTLQSSGLLASLCLALGLLSGESALATVGYLLAYALFLEPGGWRERSASLLPYGVITLIWLMYYRFQGYGTWGSGFYVDPMSEPVAFLGALLVRGPILLLDQWGLPPSGISLFLSRGETYALLAWAIVYLSLIAIVLLPLVRANRTARFFAFGTLLSLPLVSATLPHGRLLFFAGIGGMGVIAMWLSAVWERADWLPGGHAWQRLSRVLLVFLIAVHSIVAPLSLPLNAVSAAVANGYVQHAAVATSLDSTVTRQDLILVNPPNAFISHYLFTAWALDHRPLPIHLRLLAPGDVRLEIRRVDERTLSIRPEGGFLAAPFDNVFRGSAHPLRKGDVVALSGVSVTIAELTSDGRPAEAAFAFTVPLEDASLRWYQWEGDRYGPFRMPPLGETVHLEAAVIL